MTDHPPLPEAARLAERQGRAEDEHVDLTDLQAAARGALEHDTWTYYQGCADPVTGTADPLMRDELAWRAIDLLPKVLQGADAPDPRVELPAAWHRGGAALRTPVMVSPTAGHGMASPDGEIATGRAAAASGALMVYSNSASVAVGEFGAAMTGPWWVQVYLQRDRARSRDYLDAAVAAGAGAVVLTVDLTSPAADAPFRSASQARMHALPGNFPGHTWTEMAAGYDSRVTLEDIGEIAGHTGLPVHVKGVLRPEDAVRAIDAGAAGVIVSNHGRRQLAGVVPTARALGPVLDAVAGRAPVFVDGGIRSGTDVLRALAVGAALVGVGRPVLWGLAARGTDGVRAVLDGLTTELAQAMAAAGLTTPREADRSMVRDSH